MAKRFIGYPDNIGKSPEAAFVPVTEPPSVIDVYRLEMCKVFGIPVVIMEAAKPGTVTLAGNDRMKGAG